MKNKLQLKIAITFLVIAFSSNILKAQVIVPNDFADELITSGFTDLTSLAIDSTGRIFVGEHEGTVWRINNNGVKATPALIDIKAEVGWLNAHGLISIALDKDFTTNGYIYLYYTVDRHHLLYFGTSQYNPNVNEYSNATIVRVSRFQLDPATGFTSLVPNSRFVLVGTDKKNGIAITYNHHDGGGLQMATDGTLIITTGDGAHGGALDSGSNPQTYYLQGLADTILTPATNVGAFRSQLLQSTSGKILRIDPMTGLGVPSNPFYDAANPGSAQSKVYGLGLRQPFSFDIRPGTGSTNPANGNPGAIYINDVGFYTWEELDVADGPGQNFGWPIYEGLLKHPGFSGHKVGNLNAPNPLYGTSGCTEPYFRFTSLLAEDTKNAPSWPNICNTTIQIPASIPKFKHKRASFAYKHKEVITYVPEFTGNSPLAAPIGSAQTSVTGVAFNGTCIGGSAWNLSNNWPSKYQGALFFCEYDFGFISYAKYDQNQKLLSIDTFASNAGRPVTLKWSASQHCFYYINYKAKELHRIRYTVGVNLIPISVANQNKLYGPGPLNVSFSSLGSYDPEGTALTYNWTFGDGSSSTDANPTHTFVASSSAPQKFNVKLTVTDSLGKWSSKDLVVSVNNTPPNATINSPINGSYYSVQVAQVQNLTATATDAEHTNNQLHYVWYTSLHHDDHEHPNPPDTDKVTYFLADPEDCSNSYSFEIILVVTDDAGLSGTDTVVIYQACPPVPAFSVTNDSVCVQVPIQFKDESALFPNAWKWSFPGGSPSTSTLKNPVVTYNTAGLYNATLIAISPGGSDTLTQYGIVKVLAKPGNITTANGPLLFCSGGVNLSTKYNPTYSYQWNINSTPILNAFDTTYYATASGTYNVIVTNGFGCIKETNPIVVDANPVANVKPKGPIVICPGDSIALSAKPIAVTNIYQWTLNGVDIIGANGSTYYAKSAGNYKVRITINPSCIILSKARIVSTSCRLEGAIENNQLSWIYPNPSSTAFTIEPSDFVSSNSTIEVQDIAGRIIIAEKELVENENYTFGIELPIGVYFVKIKSDGKEETHRLVKTK